MDTTKMLRTIDSSDLWSAIRGHRMMRLDATELDQLHSDHFANEAFASRVIVKSVEQVRAMRKRGDFRYWA